MATVPFSFPCLLQQGMLITVVNALTKAGAGNSWGVPPSATGQSRMVDYSCSGTYTVCTANLQQSFDGGVTWQNVGATVDLAANPAGNLTTFFAVGVILPGPLYRFNLATFTGTSITINLAVS